jgi:GT2 family glycosyltransferase
MSPRVDLSVIIVSFNTREMTLAALRSLYAETRATAYEVIVVDNNSSDGSAAAIGAEPGPHRLIASDANLGFAAGNNLAAEMARGDYLLLLNPDTVVRDGAVDRLLAFARERPEAGIWGGRTLFGDGRLNPSSCWGRMTAWRLLCRATGLTGLFPASEICNGEAYGGWDRSSSREVDIVSGCFFLIRRDLWQRLGGFDPRFFMYGEEADLCLRAKALGARPAVTPAATILHYGGASETVRADKLVRLMAAKAALIDRHFQPHARALGLALHAAWPLSRLVACTALGALTGKATARDTAGVWREVWRRRGEWRRGWPAQTLQHERRPIAMPLAGGAQ